VLTLPVIKSANLSPFAPNGAFGAYSGMGVVGAAASIFFAYVGFDAVSTAAEETKNPQKNVPIGLIGSLAFCTVFYLLVALGAAGAIGAQPVLGIDGSAVQPGSPAFVAACALTENSERLVCSNEALAHVLRVIGHEQVGNALGVAAMLALPSVILMMIYGQTRIFFVMARDGLLPEGLTKMHKRFKTPYVVTIFTGVAVAIGAALFPVGQLADISNSGTLFAFFMVSIAVIVLRRTDPNRARPFRMPLVYVIAPLSALGCAFLFWNLPHDAKMVLPIWGAVGLVIYFLYGIRKSHLGRGSVEVHEQDSDLPPPPATT
ncbi:MAG: amino acid permease, partial [Brevundimonas sp.]